MVLVGIAHRVVLAEFFIGAVICIEGIFATTIQPGGSSFDAKVVVLILSQLTLPITTLQYSLCQYDGSRNAIALHLLHGCFRILLGVCLILAHTYRFM